MKKDEDIVKREEELKKVENKTKGKIKKGRPTTGSTNSFTLKDKDYEFSISVDKYQYILDGYVRYKQNGKEEIRKNRTYHTSLWGLLEHIKEVCLRTTSIGAETLDEAIDRMDEFNKRYEKLLAPLKKLEGYE